MAYDIEHTSDTTAIVWQTYVSRPSEAVAHLKHKNGVALVQDPTGTDVGRVRKARWDWDASVVIDEETRRFLGNFSTLENAIHAVLEAQKNSIVESGWSTCRHHGQVDYDHVCRRPDESAYEFSRRYFGESRDV